MLVPGVVCTDMVVASGVLVKVGIAVVVLSDDAELVDVVVSVDTRFSSILTVVVVSVSGMTVTMPILVV